MISRKIWFRARKKLSRSRKIFISVGALVVLLLFIRFMGLFFGDASNQGSGQDQISIPQGLNFSGEEVPVSVPGVQEVLLQELKEGTYWQFRSLVLHQRAHQWFPIIEPILKKNGIPDDFKYIAVAESYLTQSVSPRGAAGFWQLLKGTAVSYGLEVNEEVDERYHVQKSTVAACKYFKEAYGIFKSWTLTAASYNLGMSGIESEMKKQNVKNFFLLNLNRETASYMYRVLAMKEILSNPKQYGYMLGKRDLYPLPQTVTVTIDSSITDLSRFCHQQGINLETLLYFNPWLRAGFLNNTERKSYRILIPRNKNLVLPQEDRIQVAEKDTQNIPLKTSEADTVKPLPSSPEIPQP